MTNYREDLINRMTAIYGLENPIVVEFCRLCEMLDDTDWNNTTLRILVEAHEAEPYLEEDF